MRKKKTKITSISIVIPAYNEQNFIDETLRKITTSNTLGLKKEIIVVDDASTDDTLKIVSNFIKRKYKNINIVLLKSKKNQGKGASVKKGFLASSGDIVLIQDADQEYSPDDYPTLLLPFFEQGAHVVYGSRFVTNRPHRVLYFWHYIANKMLTTFSNILTNLNLTDMETGSKLFLKQIIQDIAPKIESKRFGIEAELTARVSKINNVKIYEVGVSYTGRSYEEGKKINWRDGVKNVFEILRYNLIPNPPLWLKQGVDNTLKFLGSASKEIKEELKNKLPGNINVKVSLTIIFTLGILLRTMGLTWGINTDGLKHGSPYHDEGHTASIVFDPNYNKNFGEYEISKPVYFYRFISTKVLTILRKVGIISQERQIGPFTIYFLLRIITTIFGIASIFVVYIITKNLFSEIWAQFSTLLYSLLPGHWFMSQLIKGEAIVTFFMPAAIFSVYMILKKGTLFWYLISALFIGVGMATKATFLVTLPALGMLAILILRKNKQNIKQVLTYGTVFLITSFFLFKTLYPYPFCCMDTFQKALNDPNNAFKRTSVERYSFSPTAFNKIWTEYQSKPFPFFTLSFGEPTTYLHLAGMITILLMLAVTKSKNIPEFYLLLGVVVTYFFFFASLNQYSGVNEDRYIVPLAPYIVIFVGSLFYFLDNVEIKNKSFMFFKSGVLYSIAAGVIIYTFLFTIAYYKPFFYDPRTELARFLNYQTEPEETVLIYLPSSRDKIYTLKDKSVIYTYEERAEIESGKVITDYIVLYRTINHNGRWGSLNFIGEVEEKPYGETIPQLLETQYQKVITFGERPKVFGAEKPESYITPVYDVYKKIK